MPARRQRARLCLAVTDDRGDHEVGVVERGTEGVADRVAELATLVDGPWRLRCDVARDAPGEGELLEQPLHAGLVAGHVRVDLGVGAVQPGRRDRAGTTVTRSHHVHHVQVTVQDDAVEVGVDEVQARCRAPVAEQPRLHVLRCQALAEQRVAHQVDLSHGQVVGCPPPGLQGLQVGVADLGRGRREVRHA